MSKLEELRDKLAEKLAGFIIPGDADKNNPTEWTRKCAEYNFKKGFDSCLKYLQSQTEFDEKACLVAAKEDATSESEPNKFWVKQAKDFTNGARWQFDQCKAQVEAMKVENKAYQELESKHCDELNAYFEKLQAKDAEISRLRSGMIIIQSSDMDKVRQGVDRKLVEELARQKDEIERLKAEVHSTQSSVYNAEIAELQTQKQRWYDTTQKLLDVKEELLEHNKSARASIGHLREALRELMSVCKYSELAGFFGKHGTSHNELENAQHAMSATGGYEDR